MAQKKISIPLSVPDPLPFPLTPWEKWFSDSSYTSEIRAYLEEQSKVFVSTIPSRHYQNIIELGCGDGTMLMQTILSLHYNYLGVDISGTALMKAGINLENAINHYSYQKDAQLLLSDVCSISSLYLDRFKRSPKTLVILPFNLIGIIPCVESLMDYLYSSGFDILIFSYDKSSKVDHARAEYYEKCGFTNIERIMVKRVGTLFTDHEELYSFAYFPKTLIKRIQKLGYKQLKTIPFGQIGIAYYCTK